MRASFDFDLIIQAQCADKIDYSLGTADEAAEEGKKIKDGVILLCFVFRVSRGRNIDQSIKSDS